MLWPGGLLFRYAPFEQLPDVVAAIPLYISCWREIVHVIGYSIVCIIDDPCAAAVASLAPAKFLL